jgi:hypothetical protein
MVRLNGNRKSQVMKVLFKKVQQHFEKKEWEICISWKQKTKKVCLWTRRLSLSLY